MIFFCLIIENYYHSVYFENAEGKDTQNSSFARYFIWMLNVVFFCKEYERKVPE
jgi:hypothetical protein